MTPRDHILIDMAETSIKFLRSTVCIVSLNDAKGTGFAIRVASPVKRSQSLLIDVAPQSYYRAFCDHQDLDRSKAPQIIRDHDLLGSLDQDLRLPEPLVSALQLPLIPDGELLGYLVFGEVRNWERAPFTGEKIKRALERTRKIEDYLRRKSQT